MTAKLTKDLIAALQATGFTWNFLPFLSEVDIKGFVCAERVA